MLAPGHRVQRVAPADLAALDHLDAGFAVGLAVSLAHAEERLAADDTRAPKQGERQCRQRWRQCFVALVDPTLAEQGLIRRTAGRVGREQHQSRGRPIDPVQRHQLRVAQAPYQPPQQGLFDEPADRPYRQEMRLVDDHQVCIHMHYRLGERNRRLVPDLAVVVNAQPRPIRRVRGDRATVPVQHPPTRDPVQPLRATDRREAGAQCIQHMPPVPDRQMHGAGVAVAMEGRTRHDRSSLTVRERVQCATHFLRHPAWH